MSFQLPDGSVDDEPRGGPGTLNCVDSEMHSPTNTGDGVLSAVLIEFKGRATTAD